MENVESLLDELRCGILLSDIHKSGEPYKTAAELPISGVVKYWGQSYVPGGPVRVSITANYARGDIAVRIELACEFHVPCSRCLEETMLAINGDMRYLFTTRRSRREDDECAGEEEDGYIEAIEIDKFQAELDLTPYVWETIILSLPEKVLCREDCKGLCPVCGGRKNVNECGCITDAADPRLEVLKNLL
ncbi:MAG: DUF177 domain-containing protein [Synergistaceae bacterium]|jgi:uncharacterized protein|nr:DUF177 domain-containing protein [Synergistaceae bacterium]